MSRNKIPQSPTPAPDLSPVLLEEAGGADVFPSTIQSPGTGSPKMVEGVEEPEAAEPIAEEEEDMQDELDNELEETEGTAEVAEPVLTSQEQVVEELAAPAKPVTDDGISDLFRVTDEDLDAGEGLDDLTDVDFEEDILDADDDGSLESLVSVDPARDIIGVEPKRKKKPKYRAIQRLPPPSGMGGLRY